MIPLSLLTRFITRAVFGINVPKAGTEKVEMDIGYGAVVDDSPAAPDKGDLTDTRRSDSEASKALKANGPK